MVSEKPVRQHRENLFTAMLKLMAKMPPHRKLQTLRPAHTGTRTAPFWNLKRADGIQTRKDTRALRLAIFSMVQTDISKLQVIHGEPSGEGKRIPLRHQKNCQVTMKQIITGILLKLSAPVKRKTCIVKSGKVSFHQTLHTWQISHIVSEGQ